MLQDKKISVIDGDFLYPKSECIIIPANACGIMSRGILKDIKKTGRSLIEKEIKEYCKNNKVELGDYVITGPGRFKRRGVKKIYHCVIKKMPSDFTSIIYVEKSITESFRDIVKDDNIKSVSMCGIGIGQGELDPIVVASLMMKICNKFSHKVNIKIIDNNKEFIDKLKGMNKK